MREIELLSPAKTADIGMEAIRHGADAVYIGCERFGARADAGNSVADIARLVEYAHFFCAKVYVTLNTILKDDELPAALEMIRQLYDIGVDALIIQDFGLLELPLPPIPLHASTQMDNRTAQKVEFLHEAGFEQVVLARELSIDEIRRIHERCPGVRLECFVHGALCVSYSGQCYASEHLFCRSANRGECAQVCRMAFDLEDSLGNKIIADKHLLSLKDLCLLDHLEELLDAGVTSLKIEGRLKDAGYVKNITACYRQKLDQVIASHPDRYMRSSFGQSDYTFHPDVRKSFNRGFTDYFLHGRNADIFSLDTPKSVGEPVGKVKDVFTHGFTLDSHVAIHNGDGLCFVDINGKLQGFRVNKVEDGLIEPLELPATLQRRVQLFRNHDHQFERILQSASATRNIGVELLLLETETGFRLQTMTEDGEYERLDVAHEKEEGRSPQADNIRHQLSKLGGTGYAATSVRIQLSRNWFIPSSFLSDWRRQLIDKLSEKRRSRHTHEADTTVVDRRSSTHPFPAALKRLSYLGNVMNVKASDFYHRHGINSTAPAFELDHHQGGPLMTCRHCLQYALGYCPTRQRRSLPYSRPLFLTMQNGKRFRLDFDCNNCQMLLYAADTLQRKRGKRGYIILPPHP